MTDIVDRLRAGEPDARRDAANEIERLRAELKTARLDEREACAQMGTAGAIANAIRRRTIEAKRLDRAAATGSEAQEGGN